MRTPLESIRTTNGVVVTLDNEVKTVFYFDKELTPNYIIERDNGFSFCQYPPTIVFATETVWGVWEG